MRKGFLYPASFLGKTKKPDLIEIRETAGLFKTYFSRSIFLTFTKSPAVIL